MKIKITRLLYLIISFSAFLLNSYATNVDFIDKNNLKKIEKTKSGNSGLFIHEDEQNIRWVVRQNDHYNTIERMAETYVTSKVLQFLTSDSVVPIVAEIKLLNDLSGIASKWVNNFFPLYNFCVEDSHCDFFHRHPKEVNGHSIINREKMTLAADFTGTTDRNGGNIGVVIENDQYFAAQIDYDETFRIGRPFINTISNILCANYHDTFNDKYATCGNFDRDRVISEIDRMCALPDDWIDNLIDDAKELFLNLISLNAQRVNNIYVRAEFTITTNSLSQYIAKYLDKIKVKLKFQRFLLKELKEFLDPSKNINPLSIFDAGPLYGDWADPIRKQYDPNGLLNLDKYLFQY